VEHTRGKGVAFWGFYICVTESHILWGRSGGGVAGVA
jgi:hypothetical protein